MLVEHLERIPRQLTAGVKGLARLAHEAVDQRGESERVLDVSLGSITRISTVPKFGCGRTSCHRYV
jgi:hypothetical protein